MNRMKGLSTSAGGPMRQIGAQVVVIALAVGPVASTTAATLAFVAPSIAGQTSAGSIPRTVATEAAVLELRRRSGLTWDQLARLFQVSRRAVHLWASGKIMNPKNQEHLQRLLAFIRQIDRGTAASTRVQLFTATADGRIPFDLLIAGQYEMAAGSIGMGVAPRVSPPSLSMSAATARAPRPPYELLGALQDRVHKESVTVRAARSVRARSDERS